MKSVYIVDGVRTPFLKAKGQPGPFSAADLAVKAGQQLFARQTHCAPTHVEEVIMGCVMPSADEANIARIVALRLGCDPATPAWTVQRNCASGLQALDNAFLNIASGRSDVILAGGVEAMSRAPLLLNSEMTKWFAQFAQAKSWQTKIKLLFSLKPFYFKPVIALLRGLTDPLIHLSMGQTAEELAYRFNITREQMDRLALMSHERATIAEREQYFAREIQAIFSNQGECLTRDDGVRTDSTLEKLATLKPFFEKPFGQVTAGNSSQVTDGAALLLLASEEAVKRYHFSVLAKIVGTAWAGVDPVMMGIGPVYAMDKLMKQFKLSLDNIDYFEINEAFATQILACLAALESESFCQQYLGRENAHGKVALERLNIDGGAIACGHPVGASGARLVLHLAHILERKQAHYGIATLCIGGGQGGAMLIERGG